MTDDVTLAWALSSVDRHMRFFTGTLDLDEAWAQIVSFAPAGLRADLQANAIPVVRRAAGMKNTSLADWRVNLNRGKSYNLIKFGTVRFRG